MANHLLIDGYNLLHSFHPTSLIRATSTEWQRARLTLLRWIRERLPADLSATLVYDSSNSRRRKRANEPFSSDRVEVVFADTHADADAYIIEICRTHPQPQRLRVVTNDRGIWAWAARRDIVILSCQEFVELLEKPPQAPRPTLEPELKPIVESPRDRQSLLDAFRSADAMDDDRFEQDMLSDPFE